MTQQKLNVLYSSLYDCAAAVYPEPMQQFAAPLPDAKAICAASSYLMHEMSGPQKGRSDALGSLFNHLNRNDAELVFPAAAVDEMILPQRNASADRAPELLQQAFRAADRVPASADELNKLLEQLETYISYLPDPEEKELSLFDTAKLNAAVSSVLFDCLEAEIISPADLENIPELMQKELFLLFSFDTSGIQSFIYTITSKGALKGLRSRSFYLEIVMEVIIDELLKRAALSRANLIYSGGGHAYVLLPNTPDMQSLLSAFSQEVRDWFRETFKTALYLASGYTSCSAASLANQPSGSYRAIFRSVSEKISVQKLNRYRASEIMALNQPLPQHERECSICHRSDRLGKHGLCQICESLQMLASDLLSKSYFVIRSQKPAQRNTIFLPFGYYLTAESEIPDTSEEIVRVFAKNRSIAQHLKAVRLWIGDYASAGTFEELAERDEGIKRIGVLRADVDNLGQAFVAGFYEDYMSLPRAAAFSRSLSLFFKFRINQILLNGRFHLNGSTQIRPRKAVTVYAGGDDLFVAGAWDDMIGFAVDLHDELTGYTQDTLHISGGVGLYPPKYPIAAIARETGALEEYSKNVPGKNALTVFDTSGCYPWSDLIQNVLGEKYAALDAFFSRFGSGEDRGNTKRGNSMLYKLMSLIRETGRADRMSIPRIAYYLARLRPSEPKKADREKTEKYKKDLAAYQSFADQIYTWIRNEAERCQLLTAIQLYVYVHRSSDTKEGM